MEYRPITEEELVGVAPKGWQADDEIERFILGAHRMPITGELRAADRTPCAEHEGHAHAFDGTAVYRARKQLGMTRVEVAEWCDRAWKRHYAYERERRGRSRGVTPGDIVSIERDEMEPGPALAGALAAILRVPLAALVSCWGPRETWEGMVERVEREDAEWERTKASDKAWLDQLGTAGAGGQATAR